MGWKTQGTVVDLTTGFVSVGWPGTDARDGMLQAIVLDLKNQLTQAFIAGYRSVSPSAPDEEIIKAVVKWATK